MLIKPLWILKRGQDFPRVITQPCSSMVKKGEKTATQYELHQSEKFKITQHWKTHKTSLSIQNLTKNSKKNLRL